MAMHYRLLSALDIAASYVNGVSSVSTAAAITTANDVISDCAVNGAVGSAVCGVMVSAIVSDSMSLSSSSTIR